MKTTVDKPAAIASAARRVSELARSSELATPVGHLGRWQVRDVVAHLGGVHEWATRIVNTRSIDGPSYTKSKLNGTELCDWFDTGVEELLAALDTNDADDSCPNFNPGSSKTVAWWSRRQAHETTVHRWDIERALECTTSIAPNLAVDGIDEYLDVFIRTRGKQTLVAPLMLATTRPSRAWTLSPATKTGRVDVAAGRDVDTSNELTGQPEALLLHLWGRLSLPEAELVASGDAAVAASLKT